MSYPWYNNIKLGRQDQKMLPSKYSSNKVPSLNNLQSNAPSMTYMTHGAPSNYINPIHNNFQSNNSKLHSQPSSEIPAPNSARTESQFYSTLRRYTERIREERDISLGYLSKINELTEQLRQRDQQIDRLSKANKQLHQKLSVYNSVLSRSRAKKSMHMSMLLGHNKLTQSIIQTKQEYQSFESLSPFEQFFIIDVSQFQQAQTSQQSSTFTHNSFKFSYLFNPQNNMEELIFNFIRENSGIEWEIQPFGGNTSQKKLHYCLFLSNSPFTTHLQKQAKLKPLDEINPSYYYYIPCIVKKQIVSINGRYYWSPIVYGFVTMLSFPDYYFRLLDQIVGEINIKNEGDRSKLSQGLINFQKCLVEIGKQQSQCVYHFLSNRNQVWRMPSQNSIDTYALSFSVVVLEKFALELVIDVLILLLLEIPITVISKDQFLLSRFMFYFVYIIKPLKYPFPIVFNMTRRLSTLLQSPFPTFTGTTDSKIVDPFLNQRAVFDLDNKVAKSWPMLNHLDSSRQFLMKIAQQAGGFSKLSIVTQQIIKGHQYRSLEPYWKDFSSTQIYKNYVYEN